MSHSNLNDAKYKKKNFVLNNTTYTVVFTKRTYFYWYEVIAGVNIRRKLYAGVNRIDGEEAQLQHIKEFLINKSNAEFDNFKNSVLLETLEHHKSNVRFATYKSYKAKIIIWLQWLNDNKIHQITANDEVLQRFIKHLQANNKAGKTIKSYYQTVTLIYQLAKLNLFFEKIKVPYTSQSLLHYSKEQSSKLIDYAKANNLPLYFSIKLLFHCFIRPEEQRFLKFENINFENQTIQINGLYSKNKKTQSVAIPLPFFQELRQYINYNKNLYIIGSQSIGEYTQIGAKVLYHRHTKALKACNIEGRYSLYSWKHTGVIRAVQAGINLKDLQNQLRHHSLDMVNEYLKNLGVIDSKDLFFKMPEL